MNRRLLSGGLILLAVFSSNKAIAQNNWEAGLRLGDNFAADGTIPIAQVPRVHAAVYFDRFGVAAYGNWVFKLSEGPQNLRFYAGAGPEMFFEHQFDLAAAGDVGAEWAFDQVPVTVGFDWRPSFRLTNGTDFYTGNWGFTVRFRFGEGTFVKAE